MSFTMSKVCSTKTQAEHQQDRFVPPNLSFWPCTGPCFQLTFLAAESPGLLPSASPTAFGGWQLVLSMCAF